MENHKSQEQLDSFAKKYVKEIPLERTSEDFTKNIMSAIQVEKKSKIRYAPLMTWKAWSIAAILLIGLFFLPTEKSENSPLEKIGLDFKLSDIFQNLPSFEAMSFSDLTIYAVLMFGVMMSIQVFYLKGYFERRFNS